MLVKTPLVPQSSQLRLHSLLPFPTSTLQSRRLSAGGMLAVMPELVARLALSRVAETGVHRRGGGAGHVECTRGAGLGRNGGVVGLAGDGVLAGWVGLIGVGGRRGSRRGGLRAEFGGVVGGGGLDARFVLRWC